MNREKSLPELSAKDYAMLDQALAEVGSKHRFKSLVAQYELLVGQLEGYDFSIYDYDNDLAVRDWLEGALERCEVTLRARAQALIAPLDQAFFQATKEHVRKSWSKLDKGSKWHQRLPLNPGPELASDIESGNI